MSAQILNICKKNFIFCAIASYRGLGSPMVQKIFGVDLSPLGLLLIDQQWVPNPSIMEGITQYAAESEEITQKFWPRFAKIHPIIFRL